VETQSIVVLDFGAQYSQLIARRIREVNVFSAVLPCNASLDEIRSYSPVGIILSGGPCSVYDTDAPVADAGIFDLGLPVLGICYGLQYMVFTLGGKVRPAVKREYGHAEVAIQAEQSRLFEGIPKNLSVWMSHGDEAEELPAGFQLTAKSPNAVAGIENAARRMWAVQFHPEVRRDQLLEWFEEDGPDLPRPLEELKREVDQKLPAWQDEGRRLCRAFLRAAG
jgi:GMP synthase (glutamine-hydrolysing)